MEWNLLILCGTNLPVASNTWTQSFSSRGAKALENVTQRRYDAKKEGHEGTRALRRVFLQMVQISHKDAKKKARRTARRASTKTLKG